MTFRGAHEPPPAPAPQPPDALPGQPSLLALLDGPRGGATFDPALDTERLNAQQRRVYAVMADGCWRTLREIADATGDPEASVSARLRDLRKPRHGGHGVERRRRTQGTWEYRVEVR